MKEENLSSTSCKIWVLIENPESYWWKKIDFNTGFLLSNIRQYHPTPTPTALNELVKTTKWPLKNYKKNTAWTLIGCQNHFDADWLFLIHDNVAFKESELELLLEQLNINSMRCFAPFEPSASLKARLSHCDLVSESKNP
ncbi:MAG: hypothetical protein ACK41T_01455 [Pseudobdellovibrio sp.]